MTLALADKKVIVANVADLANKAISLVAAEYRGLTVTEMTEIRKNARLAGVDLRVVRNTLAKRALKGTSFECVIDELSGPLFLAFSIDSPGSAARVVKDFAKEHDALKVKVLSINGELLSADEIDKIAKLPTYEEAIGIFMRVLKAPVEKFVRTVAAPNLKLVRTLMAVRDQKQ
jgi:large subunit ribosomal protein L10